MCSDLLVTPFTSKRAFLAYWRLTSKMRCIYDHASTRKRQSIDGLHNVPCGSCDPIFRVGS